MRAGEITAAQVWAGRRPPSAPAIPEVVTEFIAASVAKEARDRDELHERQRRVSAGLQRLIGSRARQALEACRPNTAMRLALAGQPTEIELKQGIATEPSLRAELAAAAQAAQTVACFSGHSSFVTAVEFSPDGTQVVTASWDSTARIWDVRTGSELVRLGHDGEVTSAGFSPDGGCVVTSSYDSTTRIWDARSGAELIRFTHQGAVACASFNPDGARVLTASSDGTARIWDVRSGAELIRLKHDGEVRSAAFSPDGACVVTPSDTYLDTTPRPALFTELSDRKKQVSDRKARAR